MVLHIKHIKNKLFKGKSYKTCQEHVYISFQYKKIKIIFFIGAIFFHDIHPCKLEKCNIVYFT